MKYIRTKDGRIVVIGEPNGIGYEKGLFEVHNKAGIVESYEPIEILKQADTIAKLCDEIIFENAYHSRMTPTATHTEENEKIIKYYLKEKIAIYGAIWTDKGLIYVAKMNEKGELCLL